MTAGVEAAAVARVRAQLVARGEPPTAVTVAEALRRDGQLIGDAALLALVDELRRDALGAGPLEPLLALPGVTDVLVNGPRQVLVDTGDGLRQVDVSFTDDDAVRRLAQRLAARAGRRLDDASPYVDVRLDDGTRLHAVLAPVARPGTLVSLRVPSRRRFTLDDLAEMLTPSGIVLARRLVAARAAFLVSGGTGTGKTTLLDALLGEVDPRERIVVVEDSSELRPVHPHVVGLEARPPNLEGRGEIVMRDLVRQALRMRPDRLVVGEVRGAEVVELLAALNTGHEGGCGTVHANDVEAVPARLEALGLGAGLSREALHSQLRSAIDVVLHLDRGADRRRRLAAVGVVVAHDGVVAVRPVLRHDGIRLVPTQDAALLDATLAGQR